MTENRCFIEFAPAMRTLIDDAIKSLILFMDEVDGGDSIEDEGILRTARRRAGRGSRYGISLSRFRTCRDTLP